MLHVEQIKEFISKELANDENIQLKDNEHLIESGMIDSLGIMKLILYLEETYKLSIGANDILPENFETVEAISTMVGKILNS